jgi:uncharacterized membrane protein YfcA
MTAGRCESAVLFFRKYFLEGQQVSDVVRKQAVDPRAPWWQRHRKLVSVGLPILLVWGFWWPFMASGDRWHLFREPGSAGSGSERWELALTMVFGSFVAGSTSEGGAAVAFPVMTLALGVPPPVARDFSFMIQSVGMVAAAFSITVMRVRVEWRAVLHVSLGGAVGLVFSLHHVAPRLTPAYNKMYFVMIWSAFAFSLFWLNRLHGRRTFAVIPCWGQGASFAARHWRAAVLQAFGFVGGVFSGMAGSGIDICSFACLTLLFRVSEKTATPTSVVLMGVNTAVGFLYRELGMGGVEAAAWPFLWVCMPIVVIGAPLGAMCGSYFHRLTLAWLIYVIDFAQLLGALAIVRPWLSKARGGKTDTPLHLTLSSAAIFCFGALFFRAIALLGVRLMESVQQEEEKEQQGRAGATPCAADAEGGAVVVAEAGAVASTV